MNIYFSGIGGVGIGPLAEIAHDAGYDVTGSDLVETPITKELRKLGIDINIGQDGSFLQTCHNNKPVDWFIYTSALNDDHPELVLARELGIKTAKRDELLEKIIEDKGLKLIAIAGTHGKTTTTSMLVWTLQQLGVPVSYSIGSTVSFGPSGKFDPSSEYFVYECDEYDRNFLQFKPFLSLITTIDYDHTDTYSTISDYLDAFVQFSAKSQHVITWEDQHGELFRGQNQVKILEISEINDNLAIAGKHNRKNATLVQIALNDLGYSQQTDDILASFPGSDRRFEKLADGLYSDYGHLPAEIAATLQLASEISDDIVLVYQPHQNIRQHEIRDQYTDQFEIAKTIYWLPTYLSTAREDPNLAILKPEELIQNIKNKEIIHVADFNDGLWNNIQKARGEGKLVLGMGAGKIDEWLRDKLAESNQ